MLLLTRFGGWTRILLNIVNLLMISTEAPPKLSRNEGLKAGSPLLGGTIAQSLADASTDHFSEDDYEFLKFHGAYQQDDRDQRKTGKHYMLMVRTKFPGGAITAAQYLASDRLSTEYGNGTMRITTRQDFQFHGILKANLRQTIKSLNEALITTVAACGDVQRNVTAPPTPSLTPLTDLILEQARVVSRALSPSTPAYHAIWIDGKELDLNEPALANFVDPFTGRRICRGNSKFALPSPRSMTSMFSRMMSALLPLWGVASPAII